MESAKEFIEKACDELQSRDDEYTSIRTKVISYLEEMLKKPELGVAFISGRNKGKTSLREKIYRKNYFNKYSDAKEFLDMLSDGIGIRIVCLLIENEKDILNYLFKTLPNKYIWNNEEFFYEEGKNVYINLTDQPQRQKNEFYIYRMDALWIDEKTTVRMEIQVKSLTHLLWGEVEHSLFYKNYDYVMSNDYYSNLMKSINIELENIDLQISTLQRHLQENETNTSEEIRQIAGFVLAKHFKNDICKCVGCEIDLREVYDAYVDMEFLYDIDSDACFRHLQDVESSIHNSKNISYIYKILDDSKVDYTKIAENVKKIVETIDDKVKEGDIFWKSFVSMYISLKNRDDFVDYSDELSSISKRFYKMISPFRDDIEMFDDEINELIRQYMMKAVIDVFADKGKLGFFSIEHILRKMCKEMNLCSVDVQYSIFKTTSGRVDKEVIEANQDIFYEYFRLNYKRIMKEKIMIDEIRDTLRAIENSEFQLGFEKNVFPYVLKQKNMPNELSDQINSLYQEEINNGI